MNRQIYAVEETLVIMKPRLYKKENEETNAQTALGADQFSWLCNDILAFN